MKPKALQNTVHLWIKNYLAGRHARALDEMLADPPFGRHQVLTALQHLLANREIEVLEPVAVKGGSSADVPYHPDAHFRLVRESDTAYRWQERAVEEYHPDPWLQHKRAPVTLPEWLDDAAGWLWIKPLRVNFQG